MKNKNKIYTKKSLWLEQAPSFHFELNEDQLLKKALKEGFVVKIGNDIFLKEDK